jgi:hypothetical protein
LRRVEIRLTTEGERCASRLARLHRDELASLQGLLDLEAA